MAYLDYSLSSLLCQETDEYCFVETEPDDEIGRLGIISRCSVSDNDEEYIENLIKRGENDNFGFGSNIHNNNSRDDSFNNDWFKVARLDAIEWIFHTRAKMGFQIHTGYLSVVYFDQFFAKWSFEDRIHGKLWAIRLLSVACLSLAAKMEECRIPALSEFPLLDYAFESKVIQRMELLVLTTLEWKMGLVTPFAYLHYFISKVCCESMNKHLVSRAVELILAIVKEINLVHHRPSAIAAAAVLAASDAEMMRKQIDLKFDFICSRSSLQNEILIRKSNSTPNNVISPSPSSMHCSSKDVHENSSVTHAVGVKRKVTFISTEKGIYGRKITPL